jgi:hypothetical protein
MGNVAVAHRRSIGYHVMHIVPAATKRPGISCGYTFCRWSHRTVCSTRQVELSEARQSQPDKKQNSSIAPCVADNLRHRYVLPYACKRYGCPSSLPAIERVSRSKDLLFVPGRPPVGPVESPCRILEYVGRQRHHTHISCMADPHTQVISIVMLCVSRTTHGSDWLCERKMGTSAFSPPPGAEPHTADKCRKESFRLFGVQAAGSRSWSWARLDSRAAVTYNSRQQYARRKSQRCSAHLALCPRSATHLGKLVEPMWPVEMLGLYAP